MSMDVTNAERLTTATPTKSQVGAYAAVPVQEREPCGEDCEGRGGRARVLVCAVRCAAARALPAAPHPALKFLPAATPCSP